MPKLLYVAVTAALFSLLLALAITLQVLTSQQAQRAENLHQAQLAGCERSNLTRQTLNALIEHHPGLNLEPLVLQNCPDLYPEP
jgi:hypothetical protein